MLSVDTPPDLGNAEHIDAAIAAAGVPVFPWKGESLAGQRCRVWVTEVDPICALQACMAGYTVTTVEDALPHADIYVTATGNRDILTADHMSRMKDQAIVCNIGHFDNEIQVAELEAWPGVVKQTIKPQLDLWQNQHEVGVTTLSKQLDEEVARLHLAKLGAKLTTLRPDQAEYIGVPVEGPYKPDWYRY